ncbi:MAG TPA: TetR/AcrR family transcriptional regulator [Rubricoccaceae bacterium]|nr:TetR/AcrR family transcriptional regulator [Rubricoccaceae bacterium]
MPDARPNGADLRRAILDRSRSLLVEEGYHHLSMRKIARAVGCSATSIYLHFESKDALIHALIDEGMARLHDRLEAARDSAGRDDDPAACLAAMARAYVAFGLENPEYYQVMFQLHPDRMARYPAEHYRRARRNLELFAGVLARGAEAGTFRVENPDVGAHVLWTALHGLISLLLAERVDVRIADEAFVEAAIRHALDGFRVGAPAS